MDRERQRAEILAREARRKAEQAASVAVVEDFVRRAWNAQEAVNHILAGVQPVEAPAEKEAALV